MIIAPMPSEREKNICPPAVDRTERKSGASSITPFATAQPGMNMYLSPSTAPGSVQARTIQMSRIPNSAGMPTEQTFSMPPPTPPMTITIVMRTNTSP